MIVKLKMCNTGKILVEMSVPEINISTKILPVVHTFSLTIMTYLKMLIGIRSLPKKGQSNL